MKANLHLLRNALAAGLLTVGLWQAVTVLPVGASRLPNGRVVFDWPLELVEITPLSLGTGSSDRYQVVIEIPVEAGEPLEALSIEPREYTSGITFDIQGTEAFIGKAYGSGPELPLASIGGMPIDPDHLLVVFEEPVAPGNVVTVVLSTKDTPVEGIYELGVTAYPAGEDSIGQFLGYTQLRVTGQN